MSCGRLLQGRIRSLVAAARGAQLGGCWAGTQAVLSSLPSWSLGLSSQQPLQQQQVLLTPFQGFAAHYAKGKGKKQGSKGKAHDDDDDAAAAAAASDPGEEPEYDHNPFETMMQHAVEHFMHELSGVRTGRANPGLIENLLVDAHGDHLPVKACGTVTVRNPQLLAVTLFDPGLAKAVEKAIRDSPLSLNPTAEGAEVLVKLPRLTKDTIEKMIKLVNMEAESAHQSIRRARQKAMDAIKKAYKNASADDKKRTEKELQKLHDQYIAEIERLTKLKDTELRQHKD